MDDDAQTNSSNAAAATASSRDGDDYVALTLQTLDQLTTIFSFPLHIAQSAIEAVGPEDVTQCYNWILDNNNADDCEDLGGPVIPKTDCPHLLSEAVRGGGGCENVLSKFQQRLQQRQKEQHQEANNEEQCSSISNEILEEEGNMHNNIFHFKCQHSSSMKRPASRKRLRSDEDDNGRDSSVTVPTGQLKRDEDYNCNSDNMNSSLSSSSCCCPGKENWLCLHCGLLLCSRYENGHAKLHWEDTKSPSTKFDEHDDHYYEQEQSKSKNMEANNNAGHCIAVSLADLSVWCYECNAYLHHPSLTNLIKLLEDLKFGNIFDESGDEKSKNKMEEEKGGDHYSIFKNDDGGDDKEVKMDLGNDSSSSSKRKSSHPRKLIIGQGETSLLSSPKRDRDQDGDTSSANSGSGDGFNSGSGGEEDEDESSESSGSSAGSHQAAILATLLQGEQGEAIRAYLSRHESFNTGDMGQCVPMHMPKPPTFPDEMADFLRSPLCQSICVLAGAGMSVSSGIPDFRSAGVGMYDTIRPELLTASELERAVIADDPTLALDKGMFLRNQLPMLELKRDFILGTQSQRWKATLAHRFIELLHTKLGKLTRLYTQNIDGLELQTSIPTEKIVNVHGSMGAAACELCEAEVDFDEFCDKVSSNIKDITGRDRTAPMMSTPIACEACGNPTVKPSIVLFRGSMPQIFHRRTAEDLPECDLLIIIGTSLQVAPANSLVYRIPPTALRMVMNNEKVGRRLGIIYGEDSVRDVFAHGHSDETCLDLADKMGWLDDLAEIINMLPESSARLLRQRLEQREEEEI